MSEIRERRGLVYGVASSLDVTRFRGTLNFTLSANPKNVRAAVGVLKAELRRMQSAPPTSAELARAKSKIIAGSLVGEEATDAIVGRLQNIAINELPRDYYATIAARYSDITAAEIQRVARKYLRPDHLVEVYEGPPPS
jgi:zinc protease